MSRSGRLRSYPSKQWFSKRPRQISISHRAAVRGSTVHVRSTGGAVDEQMIKAPLRVASVKRYSELLTC